MVAVAALLLAGAAAVGAAVENAAIPSWACPVSGEAREATANVATADASPVPFNMVRLHSGSSAGAGNATKPKQSSVKGVDEAGLKMAVKDGEVLVVFYDPKCPHCRTFVMDGDPPPIEKLSVELADEKGPAVVKFNIADNRPPEGYQIVYVPMAFLIKDGKSIPYEGENLNGLKDFALQKPPKPPAIMDKLVDVMPVLLHQRPAAGR